MPTPPSLRSRSAAPNTEVEDEDAGIDIPSAVSKLKDAINDLEGEFVDRSDIIFALILAVASRQHLLLTGPAGVAKSDLARRAFMRIKGEGLVIYDKMFAKGTKEDDVFGPVKIEKYKKEAVWETNTKGKMPDCHFANLEELGRASDFLLPSLMTILNERLYHNGHVIQPCPLITAVASTNFLHETAELAAFADRWLIRVQVSPLSSNENTVKMINGSLSKRIAPSNFVSLNEIKAINDHVDNIAVDDDVVPLFAKIVGDFRKQTQGRYISDRRVVQTFKLVKAHAVISGHKTVTTESLDAAKYGLYEIGKDKADADKFGTIISALVTEIAERKKDRQQTTAVEVFLKKTMELYDEAKTQNELQHVRDEFNKVVSGINQRTHPMKDPTCQSRLQNAKAKAEEFVVEISAKLQRKK